MKNRVPRKNNNFRPLRAACARRIDPVRDKRRRDDKREQVYHQRGRGGGARDGLRVGARRKGKLQRHPEPYARGQNEHGR